MSKKRKYKTADERVKLTPDRSDNEQYINWYPGHMNKALKEIKAKVKLVDLVLDLRDARAPMTSGNLSLKEIISTKDRIIVFNKTNLASPESTQIWRDWLKEKNISHIFINALDKSSVANLKNLIDKILHDKKSLSETSQNKTGLMILGLPNIGKSTLINRLSNRNVARTADKPGYTQHQQWIKIDDQYQLLDTPGIMPPKIESYEKGLWLAAIHAIPSKIVDDETLALFLINYFQNHHPVNFEDNYKFDPSELEPVAILDKIGEQRKFLLKKAEIDYNRVYSTIISDFRSGHLGKITFELPE